jgi:hypothetical protein
MQSFILNKLEKFLKKSQKKYVYISNFLHTIHTRSISITKITENKWHESEFRSCKFYKKINVRIGPDTST